MQDALERPTAAHSDLKKLNVGIVHDWMPGLAGGERVVQNMAAIFPKATIYTLFDFLSAEERAEVSHGHPIRPSRLNSLPGVKKYYRYLLLHCTRAIEEFDVTSHDVVLSSSAALAKGVLTAAHQPHIAYIHSPARYAWDLTHEYIDNIGGFLPGFRRHLARSVMHKFRMWDMRTVAQIDHFVANSDFIRQRIWKIYRREAQVIYPPVDTSAFSLGTEPREDFYFTASRMVPYKRMHMIVEAFRERPKLRLVVAGHGPEMSKIRAVAGPNVVLLGHVSFDQLRSHMQRARAFVFAAREDFGITPVEAQACGCPVIALGQGGTAETVRNLGSSQPSGVWFDTQCVSDLLKAIDRFEAEIETFTPESCRNNALRFSTERFRIELADCVRSQMK